MKVQTVNAMLVPVVVIDTDVTVVVIIIRDFKIRWLRTTDYGREAL